MTKKAQGMSMRTIVIAAIALLVLVVLIMIFTGRIGGFTKDLDSCAAQAGFCYDYDSDEDPICGSNIVDASGDGKLTEGVDFIVTYPKKGESVKGCAINQICCHALIP